MSHLLSTLGAGHWLVLGIGLAIAEAALPGCFLLWLGMAALAVGLTLLICPDLHWQTQGILFAGLAIVASAVGRRLWARSAPRAGHPDLNQRGRYYLGRHFTLREPIVDGFGQLHVDDTQWRVSGPDLPAGTPVCVVGVDGIILQIARAA